MHQPDPAPSDIYRRRRLAALGIGAAGLIVLLVLAYILFKGGDDSTAEGAATSGSLTSSASSSSSAKTSTQSSAVPAGPCSDTSIAVKSTVDRPNYKAGDEPVFGIVITNISTVACERDFGSNQQQVIVYSLDGSKRVWSNLDCTPDPDPKVKTLEPGKQEVAQVKWQGTASTPNCEGERLAVPPGAYTVVAQLGTVQSVPEPFNIG